MSAIEVQPLTSIAIEINPATIAIAIDAVVPSYSISVDPPGAVQPAIDAAASVAVQLSTPTAPDIQLRPQQLISLQLTDETPNDDSSSALSNTPAAETDEQLLKGQPLYLLSNGHLRRAIASSRATAAVCGLAAAPAAVGIGAHYQTEGVIERSDWTPITGSTDLMPGQPYFLSPSEPGRLTPIAPIAVGQVVVMVGQALSARTFDVEVQPLILL